MLHEQLGTILYTLLTTKASGYYYRLRKFSGFRLTVDLAWSLAKIDGNGDVNRDVGEALASLPREAEPRYGRQAWPRLQGLMVDATLRWGIIVRRIQTEEVDCPICRYTPDRTLQKGTKANLGFLVTFASIVVVIVSITAADRDDPLSQLTVLSCSIKPSSEPCNFQADMSIALTVGGCSTSVTSVSEASSLGNCRIA
jgi:hypothetical protein